MTGPQELGIESPYVVRVRSKPVLFMEKVPLRVGCFRTEEPAAETVPRRSFQEGRVSFVHRFLRLEKANLRSGCITHA